MEQLNYRENLNKEFKRFSGGLRSYNYYEVEENKVNLYFSSIKITITYLEGDIVKVFVGEKYENSSKTGAIVEGIGASEFKVEENKDYIMINGSKVVTLVNKLTSEITFKDINGNTICEDFQPTFKDEEGNIYIKNK